MLKEYVVKASYKDYDDLFYRTFVVPEDTTLESLACMLMIMFNTECSHSYAFELKEVSYLCSILADEYLSDNEYLDISVPVAELFKDENALFIYDMGCKYTFNIKSLSYRERLLKNRIAIVIDGKGYGIMEDNIDEFNLMLNGEKSKINTFLMNGKEFQHNFDEFDVDKCNKKLKRDYSKVYNLYLYGE